MTCISVVSTVDDCFVEEMFNRNIQQHTMHVLYV